MTLMRKALESYDAQPTGNVNDGVNQTIVMKGPLSDIYTRALNIAYAKPDKITGQVEPVEETTIIPDMKTGKVAPPANPMQTPVALENMNHDTKMVHKVVLSLESQAIDAALMEKLSRTLTAAEDDPTPTDSFQTVYGVSRDDLDDSDLVNVTNEIATQPTNASEYIVVIDRTGTTSSMSSDESPERMERLSSAIECLVDVFKGKVFYSLEEYIQYKAKELI